MAKCPKCGKENPDQARFCRSCGAAMGAGGAEAGPPGGTPEQRAQRLLEEAFRLSEESRILAAIQACQQALTINPNSVSAHSLLATLYERQGDRDAAIREYEQVLTLSPESTVERRRLNELMGVPTAGAGVKISPRTARLALTGAAMVVAVVLVGAIIFYSQAGREGNKKEPRRIAVASAPRGQAAASAPQEVVPPPGSTWTLGRRTAPPPRTTVRRQRYSGQASAGSTPRSQYGQWVAPGTYILPGSNVPVYGGGRARPAAPSPPISGAVPYQGVPVVSTPSMGPPEGMARLQAQAVRQRARDYYFSGDYQRSIRAYQDYLAQRVDAGPQPREELAWVYVEAGSKQQALSEYRTALAQYRRDLQRGHNVEAARHGIRTCQAAIKALQSR